MKTLKIILAVAPFVLFYSCSKSDPPKSETPLSSDQLLVQQSTKNLNLGEVDLSTVRRSNSKADVSVLTATLRTDHFKKFVLKIDKRTKVTSYTKYVFETNISKGLLASDEKLGEYFIKLSLVDVPERFVEITFKDGKKEIKGSLGNLKKSNTKESSALTDCITGAMSRMSFGDWVLFVATEPESVAALVLACAIEVAIS